MKHFFVLSWDFNKKKVEYYDVLPYFIDEYNEGTLLHGKILKTFNDYKMFIIRASKYQFWSRCQYEIVVEGYPSQGKQEKIDIHQQIMANINTITELFIKCKNSLKKH